MNYENGIFIFKGQRRMSSSFIFHSSSFIFHLSGRNYQIVDSISTQPTRHIWFCLLLFKAGYFRYSVSAERWLSGLKQWFAKPPYAVKAYRGFESPPLRQL
jgi:hypothetical protein